MKKIFLFILLFICLKGFGQYPSKQTLGSPTSKLEVLGGVHAVKGLINGRYSDTTAANLGHIDFYNGSQIYTTTDKILWLRDSVLNKWVQVGSGGGITAANQGLSIVGSTVGMGGTISTNANISLAADLFIGDNSGIDFKSSASTLEVFGTTIKLNRQWSGAAGLLGLPAGTGTDSVVTIDQATGQLKMRNASSFGGGGSTDSSIFATQFDINKTTECPIRFDTLSQVKIVDGDLVTFRDNAFPTLEHGNQDSILMGYWKGRNHSNAGLPVLRFLSNYGLTIGSNIDIETDTVRNYTGFIVSKMRGDTITGTYSSGDDGVLYIRYSVNGGATWTSRVVIPIASGSYGVFVNKGKVFNGLNIIPYYTVSPSPVKSGVLVNHRLNGGTWDTITFANSTALQLNESALEVYPDSIYAWLRSELNTTTVYRSASADGRIWTVPVAIVVPEYITSKKDIIRMPDNRLLMNYRGREVPPDVPDEGALAISNDRGITWTKFLYDQVQVYFTYGASLYLGDATYINVHATQLVSGYGDIYRDYYNIAGCGVDALQTGIERPGSTFKILADYINRKTDASGAFVHITDIDESPLGEKDWQDTAIFRKQLSVYSSILIPASGNTGFLRVESSGGNLPAYVSGQGLDIWRQGISSYNYTTSARGPLDLYASAFSLNIGDVTFGPLSGTGNRIMGLTSAGVAYRTTVDPSSITTWTATAPIVITGSDISANAATTSTTGVVSLDANHFNVTGPGAVTLDLVNGPMAQPSAAGYMSTATQDIAGIKRYVNAMSIRTGVDPIGAITALALGQSTADQGIGIIHVSSNANTGLNHVAGKFLIGVATNAAPTTHTNRLELFEPTATGTDPIVRLGDADLTINHDGTANYAGNLGIATTVPTEKLHVTGNIRFSGALMPNNTAGTAGQVLTSAGAGTVPTWTTPSAGGSGVLYYSPPLYEVNDSTLGVDSTKMKIWPGSIIAGATMSLGSDATGDIYYRNSGGVLTRLGVGSNGNVLTLASGLPSWAAIPATTWNSITSPTGTQTLTFDDAELNAWTVNSNTETFHSITANSLTSGIIQYLGSSSLTSGSMQRIEITGTGSVGRVGSYISSSGANAAASANNVGVYSNIANSGTTSINYGFWANVNSATTNYAFYGEAGDLYLASGVARATGFQPNVSNVNQLGSTSFQFADLFLGEGAVINFDNGDATITQVGDAVTLAGAALTARWTPRVGSTTSSATPTINTDVTDIYKLTAQTADITSFTTNLSGTPVDGDILEIQITGTAARALTFGASFVSSTVTIPTTTVTTATLTVIFQWFTTSSYGNNKWVCVNSF